MDALTLFHRLGAHQNDADELLAAERTVVCVGSRLLAVAWVQGQRGMVLRSHQGDMVHDRDTGGLLGAVTCEDEALRLVRRHHPTLLISTGVLEQGNGFSLVQKAKACDPSLRTILILQHQNRRLYEQAIATHSDGILVEPLMGRGHLLLALRSVCAGCIYLEPEVGAVLRGSHPGIDPGLTDRELEVMQEVVNGLSDRQIGEVLFLAPDSVKYRLKQVYLKLGLHNRTRAAIAVLLMGLVDPPRPLVPATADDQPLQVYPD